MKNNDKRISKFFSLVLRHNPKAAGVELDPQGWCDVNALIEGANVKGLAIDRDDLNRVVADNDKKRFSLSEDGSKIRAAQGHSNKNVEMDYKPVEPPAMLFHGTATRFLDSILKQGLLPRNRQYVHLSQDEETAIAVGKRHGKPVVLHIASDAMQNDGLIFHLSENGVWLTKAVPTQYLSVKDS